MKKSINFTPENKVKIFFKDDSNDERDSDKEDRRTEYFKLKELNGKRQ